MATSFRDLPEFKRGRTGEQLIAELLQGKGWYVIPSYDYSGADNDKPPKLQGLLDSLVIPDLDVSRAGTRRWVEVKTKKEPLYFWTKGRYEHGISQRHFDAYKQVQMITGTEAWLSIYEESTGDVLLQSIDVLAKSDLRVGLMRKGKDGRSEGEMANFPRDAFLLFENIA